MYTVNYTLMIFSHSETIDELNIVEFVSSFVKKTEWRENIISYISSN